MSSLARYGTATERMAPEPGCLIDGWWGQYSADRLLDIAQAYGFHGADERDEQLLAYSAARLGAMGAGDYRPVKDALDALGYRDDEDWQVLDEVIWLADDAEAWLNEYVAPDGFLLVWEDGELFLSSLDALAEDGDWGDDDAPA